MTKQQEMTAAAQCEREADRATRNSKAGRVWAAKANEHRANAMRAKA